MKHLLLFLFLISLTTHGEEYTVPSKIKGLSVGADYIRVKLSTVHAFEFCPDREWLYLDISTDQGSHALSVILAAKLSQTLISFQLTGCGTVGVKSYPKITHTYYCDNNFCS